LYAPANLVIATTDTATCTSSCIVGNYLELGGPTTGKYITWNTNIPAFNANSPSDSDFHIETQVMFRDILTNADGSAISATGLAFVFYSGITPDSYAGFDGTGNKLFWEGPQLGGVVTFATVPTPAKDTWMRITFIRQAGVLTTYKDGVALSSKTMQSTNMIPKLGWRPWRATVRVISPVVTETRRQQLGDGGGVGNKVGGDGGYNGDEGGGYHYRRLERSSDELHV
jgi:hypothetical protein